MFELVQTCTACGAQWPAAFAQAGGAALCPQCGAAAPSNSQAPAAAPGRLGPEEHVLCSICQSPIDVGEDTVQCPECRQTHHAECWNEVGGCGTFGCSQAPALDKSEQAASAPLAAWGDTKKCPACGETIKAIALKCRYCETRFDTVDPLTAADLRKKSRAAGDIDAFRRKVVALFVLALIGPLAPVAALITAIYLIPRREQLNKAGPLYKIMGWTALGLSCLFTLLIGLFFLAGM